MSLQGTLRSHTEQTPLLQQPPLQGGTLTPVPLAFLLDTQSHLRVSILTALQECFLPGIWPAHAPITQVSNWTSFYHRALSTIQFKSAFTSLSILLPWLDFSHCSHKYLDLWVTEVKVSSMRPEFLFHTLLYSLVPGKCLTHGRYSIYTKEPMNLYLSS